LITDLEAVTSEAIIDKIKDVCRDNGQSDDVGTILRALSDVTDLFSGKRRGFQRCDVKYHDFSHSLQTIIPFVDIIDGWNKSGTAPKVSKEYLDLGVVAVLLHDTGYIKKEDDVVGTGAKYTFTHIQRSIDFAGQYLGPTGFDADKVKTVQNAIRCTDPAVRFRDIPFRCEEERIIGYALGTADLLSQMSAADYSEKLPVLYREFSEAYQYEGLEKLRNSGVKTYRNAKELINSTSEFYNKTVLDRLRGMNSLYNCISYHYGGTRNPYIEAIEKNIKKIQSSPTL
jgi:hypothetical protein